MLDCHCHFLDISPPCHAPFLVDLKVCGIKKVYCNSVGLEQWHALTSLASNHQEILPFYGIHPWHIRQDTVEADLRVLATLLGDSHSFCGEIGLDRLCRTDLRLQEEVFIRQLDLAMATKSFVAIHCVKAWGRLIDILAGYQGEVSFMLHAFQGSREVMERLVAMGGMISFSHRVMDGDQQKLQDVLRATPLDNLLLETDFPFQKSFTGHSRQTYCQVLSRLYSFVSQLCQVPVKELTHIIERNGSICTY